MITLQVTDKSTATTYATRDDVLILQDDVKVEQHENGLALVEPDRKHLFNQEGEYIGTEVAYSFGVAIQGMAVRRIR